MDISGFITNDTINTVHKMKDTNCEQRGEQKLELEDQFILRLPPLQAEAVRTALKKLKAKKFKKFLSITLKYDKKDIRKGTVKVKKQQLHAKLIDLPCIIESYKTIDKIHLFKNADILQMLICQKEEFDSSDEERLELNNNVKLKNTKYVCQHGITAPLKNVRNQRFRKVLKNKDDLEQVAEIEKEVLWLLRADNEAVSTRFEVYYERSNQPTINECTIFGGLISDSDTNQESPLSSAKTSTSELNESVKASTIKLNESK